MGKEFRNDCRNVIGRCMSNICPISNQVGGSADAGGIYMGESKVSTSNGNRIERTSKMRKRKQYEYTYIPMYK